MYPDNIELIDCTASEKHFYYALKEQLSERYHVFFSVKWYTQSNGVRENSESDFLIFDPDFGYLTIEVKGGKGIHLQNDTKWVLQLDDENFRELKKSPFSQAEESMRFFKKYYQDQYGQVFRGVYGYACAFPFYNIPSSLTTDAPKELIIDYSDLSNLEQKINNIFHYWRSTRMNIPFIPLDMVEKFVKMINKRISLSAILGATLEQQDRKLARLNTIQDNIIDLTENYLQAFFVGGAGTGKTWIGLKKAIREALDGKNVLILCFNNELAAFLNEQIVNYPNIDCKTFWQLASENVNNFSSISNDIDLIGVFEALSERRNLPKYDAIIVDEAQDFNEEWALGTRLFLRNKEKSSLYVFQDIEQNIFNRNFKDGFLIHSPPFILKENLRNTAEIMNWIKDTTRLGNYTKSNSISGLKPEKYTFKRKKDMKNRLESLLKQLIQKELIESKSITILSNRKLENSILEGRPELGPFKIVSGRKNLKSFEVVFKTFKALKD